MIKFIILFKNFSKFDGIFLLKYLADIVICNPIIHERKLISIQFAYNDHVIHFRDSYYYYLHL